MLDFTGRWVSSSCFCAGPEGAASARGGVVPGSYAVIGGRLTGGPWSLLFLEPCAWESNEHKPGADEKGVGSRLDSWFSGFAVELPKCPDWAILRANNNLRALRLAAGL